jgi:transcriptional regulator with XRE-family HTH domain
MSNIKKSLKMGDKIKTARKQIGLSQKQLAEVLEVSDKAVSSYEVGRATPPLETLREISRITYKPVSYFINPEHSEEDDLESKIQIIEKELLAIKKLLQKKKKV